MAIVTETIRVVVSGANAQTLNFNVQVNTSTGAGLAPLTIPLTGVNAGVDSVTAYMDSHSLTSNAATIAWQATNGPIAVAPITIDAYASNKVRGWPGSLITGADDFGRTFPYLNAAPGANSLVFNQVVQNYPISGFQQQPTNVGLGGGYKLNPMVVVQQTASGTYSSSLAINGSGDGDGGNADNGGNHPGYVLDCYGSIIVKTAGTYTIYTNVANVASMALWIPGVTVSSQVGGTGNASNSSTGSFPASSPKFNYSPLCVVNTNNNAQGLPASAYVTFPKAGIYPFEAIYNQFYEGQFSGDNNSYFQITYLQGTQNQSISSGNSTAMGPQFFSVPLASAPPAGSTPTGDLRLTPVGGSANLVVQGQVTNLTLTVQNVTYSSIPYCPILEGTSGYLNVFNSGPTGTTFAFPTYNGNTVNSGAAASAIFSITADNSAIAGLFSVTSTGNGTPFHFNYNGGAFTFATPGSQVSSSQVTVTASDVAWFDNSSNDFDVWPASTNGNIAEGFDVDYMTKPTIASVSPSSLYASGKAQSVNINLSKPMSPQQQGLYGTGNTVTPTASLSGGATFGSPLSPILDSAGFLQGWSTSIAPPLSSTNGTITLSMTVSGTLTYLSGNSFVTGTVTYITGPVATITTLGSNVAPVGVSLTTVPASTTLQTASAPTNTPQPIRRASWGTSTLGTGNPQPSGAGNVITIYGEGRGTVFPSTLVVGAQVTLAGFVNPFPTGFGQTGQGGSTQSGSVAANISGSYTVTGVGTAIVGGSESVPAFTVTAPFSAGPSRSYDWGSSVNPPDSGWTFTAPASSAGQTTIIATEYTYDNPTSCTVQFFKKFIANTAMGTNAYNIGSPTSSPTSQTPTTVGGKTVYQKTYQIQYVFPVVSTTQSTGGEINLGFVVTDNTTGLSTTYQSTTTYYEPIQLTTSGGGGGGGGGGACFTAAVGIETPTGIAEFGGLPRDREFEIVNKTGTHMAKLIVHEDYSGWMIELAPGKLVTLGHHMQTVEGNWIPALEYYPDHKRVWFEGTVYNMHVVSEDMDDKHYVLWNGDVAHNIVKSTL
jgi:hypothetical protein